MLSPVNLLDIKPDWSRSIIVGNTVLILLAIHPEAILYVTFNKEIGRQFLIYFLDLLLLGIHVITPSFCVLESSLLENP